MSLIDNLNAINVCKKDIKIALEDKGVDMSNVKFSEYAEKIVSLQLLQSVDCIYSNGYLTDSIESNEIINFIPYEIVLDSNNQFIIELISPAEYPIYDGEHCDIVFTVDVPSTYKIVNFEFLEEISGTYMSQPYKINPRYATIFRHDVEYNSYVRIVNPDNESDDYGSDFVAIAPIQYRITIEKNI